jgi:hypothetical protein
MPPCGAMPGGGIIPPLHPALHRRLHHLRLHPHGLLHLRLHPHGLLHLRLHHLRLLRLHHLLLRRRRVRARHLHARALRGRRRCRGRRAHGHHRLRPHRATRRRHADGPRRRLDHGSSDTRRRCGPGPATRPSSGRTGSTSCISSAREEDLRGLLLDLVVTTTATALLERRSGHHGGLARELLRLVVLARRRLHRDHRPLRHHGWRRRRTDLRERVEARLLLGHLGRERGAHPRRELRGAERRALARDEALQGLLHLGRALPAVLHVPRERLHDDVLELLRDVGDLERERGHLRVAHLLERGEVALAPRRDARS